MQVNPAAIGAVAGVSGHQGPGKAQGNQGDSQTSVNDGVPPRPQSGAQGQATGVVRLLQQGHFQGVSGLRLQINFHQQLSGITQQAIASTSGAGSGTILAAVDGVVAEFVGGNELAGSILQGISSAQQTFADAATALFEELQTGAIGTTQLLASLQTAFDEFLQSIEALLPTDGSSASEGGELVIAIETEVESFEGVIPTGGEVIPVEQAVVAGDEPLTVDSPNFSAFLHALGDAFSGALEELESAFASAENTLPEISATNGNGVAFAKFLNILNVIQGGGEPGNTSSPDPQIDAAG